MKFRLVAIPTLLMLICFACPAQGNHNAVLTFTASTTSGAQYKIRRGNTPGGAKTVVASGLTSTTFTDSPLSANTQYCYDVVAFDPTGKLSDADPTSEVCGTTGKDKAVSASGLGVVFN